MIIRTITAFSNVGTVLQTKQEKVRRQSVNTLSAEYTGMCFGLTLICVGK